MKKLRKIISLLTVTVLVMGVFGGCGQKETTTSEPTDNKKQNEVKKDTPEKKSEIRYAFWSNGTEDFIDAQIERFEELNPNITVVKEALPWGEYWTKLEASAMGGAMPDVHWQHTKNIQQYVDNNLLVPVNDFTEMDSTFNLDNYPEATKAPFKFGDIVYGIPKDFDTIGLFYNKELFDAAGIAYPDENWDWDKLIEVAKQLTDKENDTYGFGAYITPQQGYYNTIMQAGGYVVTPEGKSGFDLPETKEGFKFFHDMIYTHEVSPTTEQFADTSANQLFSSGKIAMMLAGSWNMAAFAKNEDIADKFDVAFMPKGSAKKATMTNSLAYSVSTSTKSLDAAKKLALFLGSEEGQSIEASYGGAIPAYNGTASAWVDTYSDYNAKVFIDSLEFAYPLPRTKNTSKWYAVVKDYARLIISDQVSVEEGCAKLHEEMSQIISEEQ